MTREQYVEWFRRLRISSAPADKLEAWRAYLGAVGIKGGRDINTLTLKEWQRMAPGLALIFG